MKTGNVLIIDCYGGPALVGVLEFDGNYVKILIMDFPEMERVGEKHWLPVASIMGNVIGRVQGAE